MEVETELAFAHYRQPHRERLRARVRTPEWQALLTIGGALQQWKAEVRTPPPVPVQQAKASGYLVERNAERVRELLREGVTDEGALLGPSATGKAPWREMTAFPLSFWDWT